MNYIKQLVGVFMVMSILGAFPPVAMASGMQPMQVNWPQNNISATQLNDLFSKNSGYSQFNIQFPNQSTLNISPASLRQLYNSYAGQASSLNIDGKLPELVFSSLQKNGIDSEAITLPIQNGIGNMQLQTGNALNNLRYQQLNIEHLPAWLQQLVTVVYGWILQACVYLHQNLFK